MSTSAVILLAALSLLALAAVVTVVVYNRLVALRQAARSSWAQIDVQLRRRKDLIPNLVAAVKGFMAHERQVLEAVVEARSKALKAGPAPTAETMRAEGELGAALSRLLSIAEAYPQLKSDASVSQLMEEVRSTEDRIAFSRQGYNDAVEALNTRLESIPDAWVNGAFLKAKPEPFWQVDAAARKEMEDAPPQVAFG